MLLHELLEGEGYKLILASQSPRRRDLMRDSGLKFSTTSIDIDEVYPDTTPATEVAQYLSQLKSRGYNVALEEKEILITADTVVILDGEILGKPKDLNGSREMLKRLSGAEHRVVTGVTIRNRAHTHSFSTTTIVKFAQLSDSQINYYIDNYTPLDKAGSYGIQEWIGYVGIENINGSFYNVMGLPIQRLYSELGIFITNLDK